MAFSIEEFKGQLKGGGARPTLFDVNITSALNLIGVASEKFSFMCKATSLPPSTLGKVPLKYFGREIGVAGDRTFGEWSVTIINDEDFVVRRAIETWMGKINGHETNINKFGSSNPSLYKADALINHYGKSQDVLASYQMIGLFPTNLSEIALAWDASDQIEEFQVTFSIDYWLPAGISAGNLPEII